MLARVLSLATAILLTCSAVACAQQQRAERSAGLQSFVDETRLALRLPGLAVVVAGAMGSRGYM